MAENKLEIDLLINDKDALNKLRTALKGVESESKRATDSANLGWAGFAAKLFIVEQALAPVIGFMKEAVEAASEQEDAIARLNTALRLQGTFTRELSQRYQHMAEELQRTSRFSDDAILAVQQRLVTIGNVTPVAMGRVTAATLDLAAALKFDLVQASTLVAKASAGETAALSRYGIILDENLPKAQRFEAMLKLIADRMGGSAQADAQTFAGKQQVLANAWGDVMEELGAFITKSSQAIEYMDKLAEGADRFAKSLAKIREERPDFVLEELKKAASRALLGNVFGPAAGQVVTLVEQLMGTAAQNQQKAVELGEIVVSAARSAQDIWLTEQEAKEAAARQKFIEGEVAKVDQLRIIWDQWNNEKTASAMTAVQNETSFMQFAIKTQQLAHIEMWKVADKERDVFTAGVSGMFKSMVRGTLDAKEAFKALGFSMVDILIDQAAQWVVNAALSKTLSVAQVAVSKATAGAVAAAWAPAAAAAATATLGGAAASGSAGLIEIHALSRSLSGVPELAEGGDIIGGGRVMVGERGPELLDLPRGARVTPLDKAGRGDIHINIEMNGNIQASPEAAKEFARDIAVYVSEFIDTERQRL